MANDGKYCPKNVIVLNIPYLIKIVTWQIWTSLCEIKKLIFHLSMLGFAQNFGDILMLYTLYFHVQK